MSRRVITILAAVSVTFTSCLFLCCCAGAFMPRPAPSKREMAQAPAAEQVLESPKPAIEPAAPTEKQPSVQQAPATLKPANESYDEKNGPQFTVEISARDGIRFCDVIFKADPKAPEAVDVILRKSLENAIAQDTSKDILAMAFVGDSAMNRTQHSGVLYFKASEKKILSEDEWRGVPKSSSERQGYFLQTDEDRTANGITPVRKWLTLSIVFPMPPSPAKGYETIEIELRAVADRGIDADAYVFFGDKNNRTSWRQLRDSDGAFVFAKFSSGTRQISRKSKVLATIESAADAKRFAVEAAAKRKAVEELVKPSSGFIGPVKLMMGKKIADSAKPYLSLTIRITNFTDKPMPFSPLMAKEMGLDRVKLRDDLGTEYLMIRNPEKLQPVGQLRALQSIARGKSVEDVLVFDIPSKEATEFTLTFSGSVIGRDEPLILTLPRTFFVEK